MSLLQELLLPLQFPFMINALIISFVLAVPCALLLDSCCCCCSGTDCLAQSYRVQQSSVLELVVVVVDSCCVPLERTCECH